MSTPKGWMTFPQLREYLEAAGLPPDGICESSYDLAILDYRNVYKDKDSLRMLARWKGQPSTGCYDVEILSPVKKPEPAPADATPEVGAVDDGGPAFPRPESRGTSGAVTLYGQDGMALRDWLAGEALTLLRADDILASSMVTLAKAIGRDAEYRREIIKAAAETAYEIADAMLEARKAKKGGAR